MTIRLWSNRFADCSPIFFQFLLTVSQHGFAKFYQPPERFNIFKILASGRHVSTWPKISGARKSLATFKHSFDGRNCCSSAFNFVGYKNFPDYTFTFRTASFSNTLFNFFCTIYRFSVIQIVMMDFELIRRLQEKFNKIPENQKEFLTCVRILAYSTMKSKFDAISYRKINQLINTVSP